MVLFNAKKDFCNLKDLYPGDIRYSYFRCHPHLHELVSDGLFSENSVFHVAPDIEVKPLVELFLRGTDDA